MSITFFKTAIVAWIKSLNVYLIFHTLIHRFVDPNFYYKSKNRLLSPAAAALENPSISHSKDKHKYKLIFV